VPVAHATRVRCQELTRRPRIAATIVGANPRRENQFVEFHPSTLPRQRTLPCRERSRDRSAQRRARGEGEKEGEGRPNLPSVLMSAATYLAQPIAFGNDSESGVACSKAGGFASLVSVQVSVGCGQMRTEGKGAQDISRSVIVK
jgi:hypothetical protein